MSYDPQLHKNIQNTKFEVVVSDAPKTESIKAVTQVSNSIQPEPLEPEDLNASFIFNQQIQFTNQKSHYTDGNTNNYIYLLASNCNRAGLSQSDTELLCSQHFDLPEGNGMFFSQVPW